MSLHRFAAGLALLATGVVCAEPVPLADFARHEQYRQVKISPDGGHIAADAVVDNRRILAIVRLEDMKAVRVVPRGDEIVDFTWVSPTRLMYTVGTPLGGLEKPTPTGELYFVNADGSGNEILFGYRAGKDSVGSHIKSVNPERASAYLIDELRDNDDDILIFTKSWDTSASEISLPTVYKFDVKDGSRKKLFISPLRAVDGFLADHDGNVNFAYGIDTNASWQVMYRDKDEWTKVFDGNAASGNPTPLAYSRDNKTVYWSCHPDGKVGGICTWSADDRTLKPVWTAGDVEPYELIKDLDGTSIVGVQVYPGRSALGVIDKKSTMMETLTALMQQFPGETVSIPSVSKDGNRAIVAVYSDVNPGEFFLFDRTKKKISPLLRRVDKLDPDRMAAMEPVKLQSRDGKTLRGYLTRPPGQDQAKNLPLVVYVHGGPFGIRDLWNYDPDVQALASRGYAVLQVNFRGSGGYGESFETAGYKEWGGKMQDDVTDATRWAIEQGIADPKRVCIAGGSYGGYAALMGTVREPDLYRCAVGIVGVYDLRLLYSRGEAQRTLYGESFLKRTLGEEADMLAARSPITQIDKIKAKLMLVVGGQDTVVPPLHGETLHMALEKRGVAHEWLYQRTEAHGFYDEKNREDMYAKMIAFLDANIGAKAGDAATAAKP